jgi:hypothetical protein
VWFVVSYETVPANGEAVVIDVIDGGAEDRGGVRAKVLDDRDHIGDNLDGLKRLVWT